MAKGDSFAPQKWCNICGAELLQESVHLCGMPIEGTAAWYDPRLEQQYMAERSKRLRSERAAGDVTDPKHDAIESKAPVALPLVRIMGELGPGDATT